MSLSVEQTVQAEWDALRSRGITGARVLPPATPSSIRESDRSFGCVAATETAAKMIDWETYAWIDEVLLARGGSIPGDHVPLLRNHMRFDPADDIYGSAREWKLEDDVQWICRCFMSEPSDELDPVNRAWTRVRGGHLRGVSVGYEVLAFEDIQPGEKKKVANRFWTAPPQRRLRVSTEWVVRELSLTPIGADKQALIRSKGVAPLPVVTGFRTSKPQPQGSYFR
jgi:hypothetical protein